MAPITEAPFMLPDFRLEAYFSKWEFTARHHLCASDMESMTLSELLSLATEADRRSFHELRLGYTETFGAPVLREAIADTYDSLDAAHILTFAGAEEGIYAAMQVLLEGSDHAIVITPNYQAAETLPASICEVTGVSLHAENDWQLDVESVRRAIRGNTRLISINFPHNPTGKVIAEPLLAELLAVAAKHGIHVFSDEVYRQLERNESLRLPQVADLYDRGLSLNVMSKAYGLPGLRIGWIACRDRELLRRMERMKHYLSICNSAPSELLASIALKAREHILRRNQKIIRDNLVRLDEFFADHQALFEWRTPDGGCIGFPKYLGADGVENFCRRLIEEAGVLLLPSSIYASDLGPAPRDRFRIGFGRHGLARGLDAIREHIAAG